MTVDATYVACSKTEDEIDTVQNRFDSKNAIFKYLGFIFMCLLTFGGDFCYDNPGVLQDKFENELDIPTTKFVILYSIYAWPNVILCFFGGFLLDSVFGIRWGTIIYLTVALCGQLLFAMGTYVNVFWLMVLGRFLFGVGAESVNIAQNNYTFVWFSGKSLNTLFGLQSTFTYSGAVLNSLITEKVYVFVSETLNYSGYQCIGVVFFIASIAGILALSCALLLAYMHTSGDEVPKEDTEVSEPIKLSDVKNFSRTFWLVVVMCSTYYICLIPFPSLVKLFFMKKYNFESNEANTIISLLGIIPAVTSPILGTFIDKTGKNIVWVLISIFGTLFSHGLLGFTHVNPYFCMVVLGFASSIFTTSMWPMIAHVVPENQLGTAYGINHSLLNLTTAVLSMVCGIIIDDYGYFVLEFFLITWLLITLVPAVMIYMSSPEPMDKISDVEMPDADKDLVSDSLLQPTSKCTNEKSFDTQLTLKQRQPSFETGDGYNVTLKTS